MVVSHIMRNQSWPSPLTILFHRLWCLETLSRVLLLTTWHCDGNLPSWYQTSYDNSHTDIQSAQSTHYLISWNQGSHPSFVWKWHLPKGCSHSSCPEHILNQPTLAPQFQTYESSWVSKSFSSWRGILFITSYSIPHLTTSWTLAHSLSPKPPYIPLSLLDVTTSDPWVPAMTLNHISIEHIADIQH